MIGGAFLGRGRGGGRGRGCGTSSSRLGLASCARVRALDHLVVLVVLEGGAVKLARCLHVEAARNIGKCRQRDTAMVSIQNLTSKVEGEKMDEESYLVKLPLKSRAPLITAKLAKPLMSFNRVLFAIW